MTPRHSPSILIVTLYCGENDYNACKDSVSSQIYDGVIDHHCIEAMDNIAAHRACYRTIMDMAADYDLFIKLDADMVLNRSTAITEIITFWRNNNHPDHMVFSVYDTIPDRLSIGIHVFSNQCTWHTGRHDSLFVDPNPQCPTLRIKCTGDPAPFVDHMPYASDKAAYHFGLHRGLKAFQWDRFFVRPQALEAFRILMDTAAHYHRTHNPKARLALMGAEYIRQRRKPIKTGDKADITITDLPFAFWMRPVWQIRLYWLILVGTRLTFRGFGRFLDKYLRKKPAMPYADGQRS